MEKITVLDHGYVALIEHWGSGEAQESEAAIIEAARQSTQGSFRGWEQDEKLLAFMYRNNHSTPFEFCGMTIEVQAPIFVFREWHRHRTQSYNEMSARYAPLPDLNYVPTMGRLFLTQEKNRQAQKADGAIELSDTGAVFFLDKLDDFYKQAEELYQFGLHNGVPKELARVVLPVGRYSRMRATANLRDWLAFLTLRLHPDAQHEIRQYAMAVGEVIARTFPRTWNLFDRGRNG
jgi:thymidylate synthase (FAD)